MYCYFYADLLHGREALSLALVVCHPVREHVPEIRPRPMHPHALSQQNPVLPAVADDTFVTAVLVLPLRVADGPIGAAVTYARVRWRPHDGLRERLRLRLLLRRGR